MYKKMLMVAVGYVTATLIIFSGFIALLYLHNALGKAVFGLSVVTGFATMTGFLYVFNNPRCPVCAKPLLRWYELFKISRNPRQCRFCEQKERDENNT